LKHGHALFGLKDEYCCDGGYAQKADNPNNFKSRKECEDYADDQGLDPNHCFLFCPKTKYWPGSADQIALCEDYYTNTKGEPEKVKHCNCTATAINYTFNSDLCETGKDPDDAPPYWEYFWGSRTVTDMDDLTITSPNWWFNRGEFKETCKSNNGWWLLDASPYNIDYEGNCRMKSGPTFNDTCTIGVIDVLGKYD